MVTISTGARDDQYAIEVADTGVGIPEHLRERVLEPFSRPNLPAKAPGWASRSPLRSFESTGARSSSRQATAAGPRPPFAYRPWAGKCNMQSTHKERVLVVDDEPQVLVALEDLLGERFNIFKAESAEGALEVLARERDIAVVITDQRMPKMSGDELLAKIDGSLDTSRILLTGFADLSAVIRAVNEGRIFAYVTKPWNSDDLRIKVDKAAGHFRLLKELAYERTLLHDLMDNMPDGIYFKDRELRFLRANRAFAALLDIELTRRYFGPTARRAGGEIRRSARGPSEKNEAVLARGEPVQDVVREYQLGGKRRYISETKAPVRSDHGDVMGLVGISRDVTERVETAEALRSSEERLMQAQKMEAIGQLAGGIAHDFNNLLGRDRGLRRIGRREPGGRRPRARRRRRNVGRRSRASALTRQLLAFSRAPVLAPQSVNLNDVVSNVEKMLRRVIGENIEFVTRLWPSLGLVLVDPSQVEQIILNLAINARDAMPERGQAHHRDRQRRVRRALRRDPPRRRPRPLRHARRAPTLASGWMPRPKRASSSHSLPPKKSAKGPDSDSRPSTGSSGKAAVTSACTARSPTGRRFEFTCPGHLAKSRRPRAGPKPSPITGHGTILLVEDDEALRLIAARILRERGYVVLATGSPSEAREACANHDASIDLLLTDVIMPETSGPKLAQELCRSHPKLAGALHVRLFGHRNAARRPARFSGSGYLEKPFTPAVLAEKVREVLEIASNGDEWQGGDAVLPIPPPRPPSIREWGGDTQAVDGRCLLRDQEAEGAWLEL